MLHGPWPTFVCPRCRLSLSSVHDGWRCAPCSAHYPILDGIVDFRVAPDPWIGIEDDRAKARLLLERTRRFDFEQTVTEYWAITPSTPAAHAKRFVAAVLGAEQRTREWLETIELPGVDDIDHAPVLDLGCGTGEMLAILAERGVPAIGIDIAMRWLVQARRRSALAGGAQLLVCCNAEHLPFANCTMSAVTTLGMLEHCMDPRAVLREAHRVMRPGAPLHVRTINRFSLLPEPHVNVVGVGWLPRRLADGYVRWRSGQRYLHHRPLSAVQLRGALLRSGFTACRVNAATVLPSETLRLSSALRRLMPVYRTAGRMVIVKSLLALVAPVLEAFARRSTNGTSRSPGSTAG